MDLIRYAIAKPVTVAVGVILVVLFGVIGLLRLPVQLAPDTELPQIEIYTIWRISTKASRTSKNWRVLLIMISPGSP